MVILDHSPHVHVTPESMQPMLGKTFAYHKSCYVMVLYLAEMDMISISFSSAHHKGVLKIDVVHTTYSLVVNTM